MSEPNLFIAGTAKGGTSSLRMWLDQHPQVSLSEPKELHFFCGCPNPDLHAAADLDKYLELIPQNEVRGEASPCYLYDRASAEAIADQFPDARIVLSLRDPLERFWSHYLMNEVYRPTGLPPEEILQRSLDGGPRDPLNDLYGMGLYGQQVANYFDVLGRERVAVTFLEWLITNPDRELGDIQLFLGVDRTPLDTSERDKEYVVPKGPLGRFFLHNPRARRVGVRWLSPRIRRYLRTRILGDPSRKPEMPNKLKESLRSLYHEDCNLLENTLGEQLPWGWHRSVEA